MSDKTKKYKQSLIDFFGDDNVREWIKVETTEEIYESVFERLLQDSYMSVQKNKEKVAFENYVIKNIHEELNPEVKQKMEDVVKRLYNQMMISNIKNVEQLAHLSDLFKSKLLRTDAINQMASPEQADGILKTKLALAQNAKKIAEKFAKYFDLQIQSAQDGNSPEQSEELKRLSLTDDEKKILINFMMITKNDNQKENKWIEDVKEKYFVSLLIDPYGLTDNKHEQEFIGYYTSEYFYKLEGIDRSEIGYVWDKKDDEVVFGFASNDFYININMANIHSNLDLVQTVLHEKQHLVQSNNLHNGIFNKKSYYYLLNEITRNYPQEGNTGEKEYDDNYEYMEIELDSEDTSYKNLRTQVTSLLQKYVEDVTKTEFRIDKMIEQHRKRRYIPSATKKLNGKNVPQFAYNISRLKQIVADHPEVLNKYPMLHRIFGEDAKIKNINNIIGESFGLVKFTDMIDDVILNEVYENKFDNIDLSNLSEEERENANNNLSHAFRKVIKNNMLCIDTLLVRGTVESQKMNINLLSRFLKYGKSNREIFEGNYTDLRIMVQKFAEHEDKIDDRNPFKVYYKAFIRDIAKICEEHDKEFAEEKKAKSSLLRSAVEATEGCVKTSDINQQVRNIQEATIQRGRNNETREEI